MWTYSPNIRHIAPFLDGLNTPCCALFSIFVCIYEFFGRYRIVTATFTWIGQKCYNILWIRSIGITGEAWCWILDATSSKTTVANIPCFHYFNFWPLPPTLGQPICKIAKFWVHKWNPWGLITLRQPCGHLEIYSCWWFRSISGYAPKCQVWSWFPTYCGAEYLKYLFYI